MCPLYPFHIIVLYLCLLLPLLLAVVEGSEVLSEWRHWNLTFTPKRIVKLEEYNSTEVQISCTGCDKPPSISDDYLRDLQLTLRSENSDIVSLQCEQEEETCGEIVFDLRKFEAASNWSDIFSITGNFMGFTKILAEIKHDKDVLVKKSLPVSIVRKKTIQAKVFSYSVAFLISLAYINMGCALDLNIVKEVIKKPIGPAIGFVCQFILMPLISFGLGFLFPATESAMRLGLFVTGVSPGGGASNIWTLMLGGNLNLSITMTAISTFSSFFMMPLWIFTLGTLIFNDTDIKIPYYKICIYAIFLVVPLGIGLLISRFLPRVSKFLVRILKPMALFLILFIIFFGIWANLYIFRLMTWSVFLTGMALPWMGFAFGFITAKICRRPMQDIIAIAVETGVQNTGVSIFILWFTLDQPAGDMTAVVPMAAATMTPIPLLMALLVIKFRECWLKYSGKEYQAPLNQDEVKESESKQKLVANGDHKNGHCLSDNGNCIEEKA